MVFGIKVLSLVLREDFIKLRDEWHRIESPVQAMDYKLHWDVVSAVTKVGTELLRKFLYSIFAHTFSIACQMWAHEKPLAEREAQDEGVSTESPNIEQKQLI